MVIILGWGWEVVYDLLQIAFANEHSNDLIYTEQLVQILQFH